jgi:hypothetical protein
MNDKINIGYFGIFYKKRCPNELLALLDNRDVCIHIFTDKEKLKRKFNISDDISNKVKINNQVSVLEMLNIASKMDYLYIEDANFDGPLIPYLPSKLADYFTTGTKIIAKINTGSPLSKVTNNQLIKTENISNEFAMSLRKVR